MKEPTYKQHKILEKASLTGGLFRTGKEADVDEIYILVRGGYLNNLVVLGGKYEWRFMATDKGIKYLNNNL